METSLDNHDLITFQEAASMLGLSEGETFRLIEQGKIKRYCAVTRVSRSEVEAHKRTMSHQETPQA